MAVDNGPASNNPSLFLGIPPTAGVEVHVGNPSSALNSLSPQDTVNPIDPNNGAGSITSQTRTSLFLGGTASIRFLNPA